MRQEACLTCRHARPVHHSRGMAMCLLTDAQYSVLHVCEDFYHLSDRYKLQPFDGFPSCSVSTTATNSTKPEKAGVF